HADSRKETGAKSHLFFLSQEIMKSFTVISFFVIAFASTAKSQGMQQSILLKSVKGTPKEIAIPFAAINLLKDTLALKRIKAIGIPSKIKANIDTYTFSRSFKIGTEKNGNVVYLPTFLGITKQKEAIVIFDANLNNNFADDSVLLQRNGIDAKMSETIKEYQFTMDSMGKSKIFHFRYTTFRPKGINLGIKDENESKFFLMVQPFQFFKGAVQESKDSLILLDERFFFGQTGNELKIYHRAEHELPVTQNKKGVFNLGDTLMTEGVAFKFENVSFFYDTLYVLSTEKKTVVGHNVGYQAAPINMLDISGRKFVLLSRPRKYLLLDFWGTWCGPCIALIPNLKKIQAMYQENRLEIVGVALDNNPETVKKFADKKGVTWRQLFQSRNNEANQSIINDYKVKDYPTSILIDPSGKIIFRTSGKDDFVKLEEFLRLNIKPN
ncbi:MAG: TlpA family protein disulfide reductase, partial [Bacteroidota bacterium]